MAKYSVSKGNNKYMYLDDEALDDTMVDSMKHDFNEKVSEYYKNNHVSSNVCQESVGSIMKVLISNEVAPHHNMISKWDKTQISFDINIKDCKIEKIGGKSYLFSTTNGVTKRIIPWENSFDFIWQKHLKYDHPEPAAMKDLLYTKFILNTYVIECINEVCLVCASRKKPHAQISLSLVYMGVNGDYSFRYVMVYQDLLTKFIQLRPISYDFMQKDITLELLQIFTDFGPPIYIETCESTFDVAIDAVMGLLQFFKYSLHKIRKESNKNDRILSLFTEWMNDTHCSNWGIGCHMLQWKLNNEIKSNANVFEGNFNAKDPDGKGKKVVNQNDKTDSDTELEVASKSINTCWTEDNEITIVENFPLKLEPQSPMASLMSQENLSSSESEDDYYLSKFLSSKPGPSNQSDITQDSQSSSNSVPNNVHLKIEPDSDSDDDL